MITYKLCEKCHGQQRINKGWIIPRFVPCDACEGRGETQVVAPEYPAYSFPDKFAASVAAITQSQKAPARKVSTMFDTLTELDDAIDNVIGEGWRETEVEFVTPDGKRWRVQKFKAVCHPDTDDDILECQLIEMRSSATAAKAPETISQLVAQTQ